MITLKDVIDDVYEGKIANAREKFVTAAIIPNRSDDLYYNDGYSSMEEKQTVNSFAKFKEWQKKQVLEKNSKMKDLEDNASHQQTKHARSSFDLEETHNLTQRLEEDIDEREHHNNNQKTSSSNSTFNMIPSPSPKFHSQTNKKEDFSLNNSEASPHARASTPTKTEIQTGQNFVRLQSPKRIASSPTRHPFSELRIEKVSEESESQDEVLPKIITTTTSSTLKSQQPSTPTPSITITPTSSVPPKLASPSPETQQAQPLPTSATTNNQAGSNQSSKHAQQNAEDEVPQKSLNPKQKLKSILSVFKLTKKKQEEATPAESSSETEQNMQDKDDNHSVSQKLKKMNMNKLIPPLQQYLKEIEETLKDQKEKFNKMSLNYKLENKDAMETLCYLNCPKTNAKQRIQAVESIKANLSTEHKCLAVLDIVQCSPVPLISSNVLEASESEQFNMQELESIVGEQVSSMWQLIINHINALSKVEPKWKEPLLKLFSEALCRSIVPSTLCTSETKNKTKYILKTLITKSRNDVVERK